MIGLHLQAWTAQVRLHDSFERMLFLCHSVATELSVVEAAFKISQAGGSGVVDELRDALVDTYA